MSEAVFFMGKTIGVRELKNKTSQIVRTVREEAAEYVITVRGEPVAVLRPLTEEDSEQLRREERTAVLRRLDNLAENIANNWASEKTGLEILEEMRQEQCQSLMQA